MYASFAIVFAFVAVIACWYLVTRQTQNPVMPNYASSTQYFLAIGIMIVALGGLGMSLGGM